MKVLILFCLAGVSLLASPASARSVKGRLAVKYYNNNRYNNKLQGVRRDESVELLGDKASPVHSLETTLEPPSPQTTKASTHGEKRPSRPNSKFLKFSDNRNGTQPNEDNNEMELVENTTESPLRKLTTSSSKSNSGNSTKGANERLTSNNRNSLERQTEDKNNSENENEVENANVEKTSNKKAKKQQNLNTKNTPNKNSSNLKKNNTNNNKNNSKNHRQANTHNKTAKKSRKNKQNKKNAKNSNRKPKKSQQQQKQSNNRNRRGNQFNAANRRRPFRRMHE